MAFDVEEYAKKRKLNKSTNSEDNGNRSSGFDVEEYVKQRNLPQVKEHLNSSINSWLKKNDSFVNRYITRFSEENPSYRADASDWLSTVTTQKSNLEKEAKEIKSWLDQYKDYLDNDEVSLTVQTINDNLKKYGYILSDSTKDFEYWSQWETEDAYKEYVAQQEDYNKKLTFDLQKGQVEINDLQAIVGTLDRLKKEIDVTYNGIQAGGRGFANEQKRAELQAEYDWWVSQYGDYSELSSALSEKKAYYTLAERVQKAEELASVAKVGSENYDPAFAAKSKYKSTASSAWHKGLTSMYGMGYDDLTYEYINGDEDFRAEVNRKHDSWTMDNPYVGGDTKSMYESAGYDYMTDDEIAIYNYYYNTEGKEKAQEYLDSLEESLQVRYGTKMAEGMEGKPVAQFIFAVEAGLDQFGTGIANMFSNEDYMPPSATQVASGIIREDLANTGAKLPDWLGGASLGQVGYDILNTTSNMLPSILTSAAVNAVAPGAGAVVGAGLMGASAGGHAKAEMLNLGYSKEQANAYGVMVGAAEAGMEYLLGGISKLGGKASGGLTEMILSKVDNAFARTAIKIGGSMASEGFEEGLQTVIEPWLKEIATSVDWEDPKIDEVLYSSLLGALSAFGLEGAGTVAREVGTHKSGKTIQKIEGGVGMLQDLATNYFSADTVAHKIASKVNAQTDAYTIGRLLNEVGGTISELNLTDIVNGLTERGIRESDAKKIAKEYQNALYRNMAMTDEQVKILENLSPLADVLRKNIIGANTTVYQRTRAYSDLMGLANEVANGKKGVSTQKSSTTEKPTANIFEQQAVNADVQRIASEVATGTRTSAAGQAVKKAVNSASDMAAEKLGVEGKYTSSETGATRLASNKKKVNIVGVDSIDKGTLKLKLNDGSIVDAEDIDFSTADQALVYEAVTNMGVNPTTAWEILKGYNPKSGQSGTIYAMGVLEAYTYGHNGVKVDKMSNDGFSALLSPVQKNTANRLGDIDARAKVEAQQKTIDKAEKTVRDEAKSKHKAIPKRKGGVVLHTYSTTLTDLQQSQVDVLERVSEGLGVTFHMFESKEDALGNRSYILPNGEVTSDNGWYDPKTGEIWIDIHAGNLAKGTIIFTAAHELTHFIRQWSPAKFKIFADFLVEQYGKKGYDLNKLIEAQIKKAADSGTTLSWDEAYEEVVADSCEAFLLDSKAAEKIAALREKDKGLANKIKTFLGQMLAKLRKVMADHGLLPESDESKIVAEMTDSLQKLYDLWTDALEDAGYNYSVVGVSLNSETASPMHSLRTWTASEYVTARKESAKKISEALGVSLKTAYKYIDDVNSIAKMIADDRARLDYEASSFGSAFVSNVEYGGSFDYTTLCKKRRIFTGTFSEIQRILKDDALTPDDILTIRNMLIEAHEEATCGLCYVEGSRANMGKFAKEFIRLYKNENPNAWIPNMADVNTPDGVEQMRINHPEAYDRYVYFWNHYGKLKDSDPALFASQQKPKLYEARKEYKGEILDHFKGDSTVAKKNRNGGIRMQSFSDFEIVHLIDTMQVIMDMSTVGLAGQAYTKVPEFAQAFGNTGLKINLSLIAKGVDADGKLILDDREGMPHETAFALREKYSKNVGTIIVTFTDEQLLAAMADPRIDFIIPFHRSQWKKGQYGAMGLPKGTKDYTYMQNEKLIKQTYHEYQGRQVKDKASNYMPNEYWDFSKSGKENAEAYLKMCAENNKRPKFYKLLDYDGNGTYSLKKDGSTDGYWKLLIDFKMYDNDGIGSPQMAVTPTFNMDKARTMLDEYKGGHSSYPVAHSVVDRFVEQYKEQHNNAASNSKVKHSVRRIVGDSGTDYGVGVYLDSTLLTDLTEDERIEMVKERIKELGGSAFTAYDSNNNAVDVHIVESSSKFKNKNGRKVRVYDHMLGYLKDEVKQEAVVLADELISTSTYDRKEPSAYPHGWLDNNGANDWDSWITYLQDKENTVWEATLKIANSANGEKILYEIYPIKMVEQSGKPNTSTTAPIITQTNPIVNSNTKNNLSSRRSNPVSTRSLLANALETTAQNDIERRKLEQYKSKIELVEAEYEKLTKIRAEIKELSFPPKGTKKDTTRINALRFEENKIANRINTYDRQLLNLESTTALKNVLQREKKWVYDKIKDQAKKESADAFLAGQMSQGRKDAEKLRHTEDAFAKYKANAAKTQQDMADRYRSSIAKVRENAAKTQRALMDKNTKSRKKAVESRNKTEMRGKIKKVVGDLKALLLDPTKDKHVPIGLQKPVAEALDIINMDTVGADERVAKYNAMIAKTNDPDTIAELTKSRDRIALQGENLADKLNALKQAYAEIKTSDDPLVKGSHDDSIEALIHNTSITVGNTSLRNMSYEQLEAVYDMYKAILSTVRNANKLFKEGRQETITDNSEAVKREVRAAGGHRDRVLKATKFLKKFGWNMLKPLYAMKLIGSDTLTRLYENVRKGEDTWAVDVNEAKEFFKKTASKYEYNTWDFKKQYKFTDSVGNSFTLTLEQIMSLYAYSKREQADKHLEVGGFIFDDAIEVKEKTKLGIPLTYEVNDANPYRLKKDDLGRIISLLDTDLNNVKKFVDEMQAYLSDVMGAKGNEVSLAMYDIKLYKEKNYFPLKSAKYFREFDPEKNGTPKIKNSGFSKKTVPQAGNPIILSNFMDVWANHVNDMSMYHAFVLPLEDFMRVYNYSSTAGGYDSVQQYIKNAYGTQANTYIETLMNDLNGGARTDPATDPIGKGMSLFKKAAVFASASVVIQQPSAIARALAYVDAKYFVDKPEATKHSNTWAEVKKYAPVAIIKEMGYFDTNMGRSTVDWIKEEKTWRDKVDDIVSKAPALADELSWCAIWKAVKREVAATTKLEVGSEAFLKKAGERFTEVVTKTQVYDSVLSRSALMRSKDTGAKMITAFMAEPTTSLNMVVDAIIEGKRGNKKFAGKVVGAVSASIILNSILVSLVSAARDDDEDETYTEKYLESLTADLLDGFNPLTYIPLVKDIWSIMQGYDVERSDMSVWSDLWASVENLFSDNKSGFEKTEGVVGSIASIFGLPLKNIMRDARGMYNLATTLLSGTPTTWAGVGEAVGGAVKDSIPLYSRIEKFVGADESKSDKLYDAITSGDQNQIDRVKAQYKDDKAIESAIRQGLRENDSRIHEAAQARYNGDIEEYKRIAKEIIAEGYFSQDTVVAAINSEINAIKKGETAEEEPIADSTEKATSIYKASDINSAFESGDTEMALEVIDDLFKTKVANGMTEKEAKSSIRSSMTSYWKPLYKEAYKSGNTAEKERIERILKASGLYGSASEVIKTCREWRTERD